MDVLFNTVKLQKVCSSAKETDREWGPQIGNKVRQRLRELKAFRCLAEVPTVPPQRCHKLSGDRAGQFSVDLKHPYRLILEPAQYPIPLKADGGVDLQAVNRVRIIEVVDTHG